MNIEQLNKSNWIIYKTLTGSRAYGTFNDNSDFDYRGIFVVPKSHRITLKQPLTEIGAEKPIDVKYYELQKFFTLAQDCNPNIIELLYMPDDCIEIKTPVMQKILDNRNLFISKKAYHTFSGYAYAQIKKAKGENKWINNPKPVDPPQREDFCWVITSDQFMIPDTFTLADLPPCRPVPIKETGIDLSLYHVSALEHVPNTYRLYFYGDVAKGVFRKNNLVCESIPLIDEFTKYSGVMIYNHNDYEKAMQDWKNYWTWMKERNPNRWVDQEKGKTDYDCKNMQHCIRLLLSTKNILTNGEPIVRFEGETLQYLRDIRDGKFSYEEIMNAVEVNMKEIEALNKSSVLQHESKKDKIDDLFKEIIDEFC